MPYFVPSNVTSTILNLRIMNNSTLIWASLSIILASHWYLLILACLGFTVPFLLFSFIDKMQSMRYVAHQQSCKFTRLLATNSIVNNPNKVSKVM